MHHREPDFHLARLLSPLALRLVVLACAATVPIVALGCWEHARGSAELARLENEALAIRWMAGVDRFVNRVESPGGARNARLNTGRLPESIKATAQIRSALKRAQGNSDGAFVTVAETAGQGLDNVSDASELSFESHVVVADLGDALDNSYFRLYAPLEAAGALMQRALQRGGPTAQERILVAGQLARARGFAETLANDTGGAFKQDPRLQATIGPALRNALARTRALGFELDGMLIGPVAPHTAERLERERHDLTVATATLVDLLETASAEQLGVVASRVGQGVALSDGLCAAGIALVFLVAAWAGVLVARRDRRELERLRSESRTLAAELGRQKAEHAQMLTEAQFDAIFDRSQMGIALLDAAGRVIERNPALLRMLGDEAPTLVPPGDVRFRELIEGATATFQFEALLASAGRTFTWGRVTVSSVDVPRSEAVAAIAIVEDITEQKAIDDRLRHAAVHDHLTGLPNRVHFLRRLDEVLRDPESAAAHVVFFIDLDHFKMINDTLGHRAGDRTLTIAAERLRSATRAGDLVARLHGDEFAILARSAPGSLAAREAAQRIRRELSEPLAFDSSPVPLSASIGVVDDLRQYASAEQVLRDADVAMYDAKKLGRAAVVAFNADSHERVLAQMRLMADLPMALGRGELHLAYQPIVDLETGRPRGFEALLRWDSPTLGVISPADFIPIAEESDAICALGRFALDQSCAMLRRLDRFGFEGLRANVNLSVAQLVKGEVAREVCSALSLNEISPDRLTLEITESGLLETKAQAAAALGELRRLGVKICVDDFGTGYSSLRYLHELPIDVLKIDRNFVSDGSGGLANEPIVQMLMTLARHLGLDAVAEGVETELQRRALVAHGCYAAQGFLFSEGLRGEALIAWLRTQRRLQRVVVEAG
jgi:diguanylate cyclase (GGDEF)-like protein